MVARARVHEALLGQGWGPAPRLAVKLALLFAIAASVGGIAWRTLPALDPAAVRALDGAIGLALAVFALEYAARLWSAPDGEPNRAVGAARRRYALSLLGLVDLAAVLPYLLAAVVPVGDGVLALASLVALVKLARFAPGIPLVAAVFRNEARPLGSALLVMLVLLVLASGAMYVLERHAQPEVFSSIPRALWWGIVTIASVGYGDMIPMTPVGRLFGGLVMLLGIAMFAVPAGILATGFAGEIRRREFVVTWQTVAKVPLFAGLGAGQIADIARLLRPQIVPENQVLVRRGDDADAMYFIMSGEVQVEVAPQPVRLKAGQFFGEIALLKDTARTATVVAVGECQLLSLGVADFRRLMAAHPDLKARIAQVVEERQPPAS